MVNFLLMSSILDLLPPIYSIFTSLDPDPYSEYKTGSTKVLNMDPIWILTERTGTKIGT